MADLARATERGDFSHRQGRQALEILLRQGGTLDEAASQVNLDEIDDDATLRSLVQSIADEHPDKTAAYRAGQTGLLGFFIGTVMKRTRGKADPRKASEIARTLLGRSGD